MTPLDVVAWAGAVLFVAIVAGFVVVLIYAIVTTLGKKK
jgi:hypothetical protein